MTSNAKAAASDSLNLHLAADLIFSASGCHGFNTELSQRKSRNLTAEIMASMWSAELSQGKSRNLKAHSQNLLLLVATFESDPPAAFCAPLNYSNVEFLSAENIAEATDLPPSLSLAE